MEQETPPSQLDPAVATVLARAEQAVAEASERLLVERLHRVLDEQGSAAIASLSTALLPLLQSLVIVLPRALTDGTSPAVLSAARTLGAAIYEHGMPLPALLAEGIDVHDQLLREVAADLRVTDLTIITAVLRISRALLDVERAVLLAYAREADGAAAREAPDDAVMP